METKRIAQIVLVVVAVAAGAGAVYRYLQSGPGAPTFDTPAERVEVDPPSGPVGMHPLVRIRGYDQGTTVAVSLCAPGTDDCAPLVEGTSPADLQASAIPPTLPGGTEVAPGPYELRASPAGGDTEVVGTFEVTVFSVGAPPEVESYAGVEEVALRFGRPREVAQSVDCATAWLPDGRLGIGSTILDPATGVLIELGLAGSELSWSPTGERLAIVTEDRKEIRLAEPGGASPTTVVREARGLISSITWSPEGDKLAYAARSEPGVPGGPGAPSIFAFDLLTGETARIGAGEWVSWSPAGGRLAVSGGGSVELVDLAGGGRTPLTEGRRPRWSPDGTLVAFVRFDGGGGAGPAWIVEADDPDPRRVIEENVCGVAFSPNGRRMLAVRQEDGGTTLQLRSVGTG